MEPTEPTTREDRLAQRASERAKRLANPHSAAFVRFLNDYAAERTHIEANPPMFVPKDEQAESTLYWDGQTKKGSSR